MNLALITLVAALGVASPFGRGRHAADIVEIPVTFGVENVNRSKVPCPTDGGAYQVAGHLVAPATALSSPQPAVTLYAHGVMLPGTYLWRIKGYGGFYDFASRMAGLGHTSVVLDRIGYGKSGIPLGYLSCLGGQADVLHQVVQHLRNGSYGLEGLTPVAFARVALAGHSFGGLIAPIEAYSFDDVDALVVLASAFDQGAPADFTLNAVSTTAATCVRGGDSKRNGGPVGYTFAFTVPPGFFHDVDPELEAESAGRLERDPCGDLASTAIALVADRLHLGAIGVPVLLVGGEHDVVFPPDAMERQRNLYTGSSDATLEVLEEAGHDYMLERGIVDGRTAAERLRLVMSEWLGPRGF